MEFIINTQSSRSLSSTPMSADLEFVDDAPLFAPSPSPLSHVSHTRTPPPIEVIRETPAPLAAIVPPVIVTLDDEQLVQVGTPEPEMVPITSGRRRGQLGKKPHFNYRRESVLLTYPDLDDKPTMEAIRAEFAKHRYRFRGLVGCFERHKATRDANGQVVAEGRWHMHIFGHLCLNSKGNARNINNALTFDITLWGRVCHANIQPPRNHTNVWYVNPNTSLYSNSILQSS